MRPCGFCPNRLTPCAGAVHEGGGEDGSLGEAERPTGGAEHCSAGAGATDPRDGADPRPGAGQKPAALRHASNSSCVSKEFTPHYFRLFSES